VIDKSSGKYRVFRTIGSSSDKEEIERLYKEGKEWIRSYAGQLDMFESKEKEEQALLAKPITESSLEHL